MPVTKTVGMNSPRESQVPPQNLPEKELNGLQKDKKELDNVAVPLSCISIRCWFAAADRSRCLALLYNFSGRGR
jgi:hypothetical protein